MRARYPDETGSVTRDGLSLGYEVYGNGDPTILLMPTWTIIHVRFWKYQIPDLARRYRVVTFDGPGNGLSQRTTDPDRYTPDAYAADAIAVLDAVGVDRAVVVGLSRGGSYTLRLASSHPDRVSAIALVGPALPLAPPYLERVTRTVERFLKPYPEDVTGWDKYNLAYWHDHYEDFVRFFFDESFNEPHSTKAFEDAVRWAMETGPEILEAESKTAPTDLDDLFGGIVCPVLVFHGNSDRIVDHAVGVEAARITNGSLITIGDAGHMPMVRDPVFFNLALRDFIERVAA